MKRKWAAHKRLLNIDLHKNVAYKLYVATA